jgi:hypothetical protein
MEKISLNSQIFDLVPNGIVTNDKKRSFTISSVLPYADIELAFSKVDRIEYLSESNEILATYLDGIALKSLSKNMDDGTYTVEISIDAIERKIADVQKFTDSAVGELTIMISMLYGMV